MKQYKQYTIKQKKYVFYKSEIWEIDQIFISFDNLRELKIDAYGGVDRIGLRCIIADVNKEDIFTIDETYCIKTISKECYDRVTEHMEPEEKDRFDKELSFMEVSITGFPEIF